jgi:hypothetical protein
LNRECQGIFGTGVFGKGISAFLDSLIRSKFVMVE